ncbi:MAG: hypothetical protein ACMUIP_03515 [bacterium]
MVKHNTGRKGGIQLGKGGVMQNFLVLSCSGHSCGTAIRAARGRYNTAPVPPFLFLLYPSYIFSVI